MGRPQSLVISPGRPPPGPGRPPIHPRTTTPSSATANVSRPVSDLDSALRQFKFVNGGVSGEFEDSGKSARSHPGGGACEGGCWKESEQARQPKERDQRNNLDSDHTQCQSSGAPSP